MPSSIFSIFFIFSFLSSHYSQNVEWQIVLVIVSNMFGTCNFENTMIPSASFCVIKLQILRKHSTWYFQWRYFIVQYIKYLAHVYGLPSLGILRICHLQIWKLEIFQDFCNILRLWTEKLIGFDILTSSRDIKIVLKDS